MKYVFCRYELTVKKVRLLQAIQNQDGCYDSFEDARTALLGFLSQQKDDLDNQLKVNREASRKVASLIE